MKPLLKSPNLDPLILSNFRPVSNISFCSKILEKVVFQQLQKFLNDNKIFDVFQSGFRKFHSTETALVKVLNDILMATDSGDSVVLVLLDLSAAFDTVDHEVLLTRLERVVGLSGTVLSWVRSYFKNKSFSVNIGGHFSGVVPLTCGVPQGSILAPLLFSLYMLPLASIFDKYGLYYHCYADDTQLYLPLKKKNGIDSLSACLSDVKAWMSLNFLNLNEKKTEIIVFGSPDVLENSFGNSGILSSSVKSSVKNLGVFFDRQINAVVKASFYQLKV